MLLQLLSLLLLSVACVNSQRRWYYTGQYKNENSNNLFFKGAKFIHSDLFYFSDRVNADTPYWVPESQHNESFFFGGGNFLKLKNVNSTVNQEFLDVVRLEAMADESLTFELLSAAFYKQIIAFNYGEGVQPPNEDASSDDYLMQAEVGLYDHGKDSWIEKFWREISNGEIIAVSATTTHATTEGTTETRHKLVFASDFQGRVSTLLHTWDTRRIGAARTESALPAGSTTPLRIMTYNLWHNNPPSWIYHDKVARWDRYEKRLRHFADIVAEEDPDVITLQEVRHDSAFTANGRKIDHWSANASHEDSGNQVDHLLSVLAAARRKQALMRNDSSAFTAQGLPYYQLVFHPAMAMIDRHRMMYHNEEGCLVLSKRPIVQSDVHLLPRSIGDASDDHQRIVLRAKVAVADPISGGQSTVDVMTTHLSLSETARDMSSREILKLTSCSSASSVDQTHFEVSPVQILTGDFNAEPHENFIQHLLSESAYQGIECGGGVARSRRLGAERGASFATASTTAGPVHSSPFVDSWLHLAKQRYQEAQSHSSGQTVTTAVDVAGNVASVEAEVVLEDGFTFPSCNPIKRIDFVLVRNYSHPQVPSSPYVSVAASRIVGQHPTEDTAYLVNSREGLGMNDMDSPVWASDHFAVVSDLLIHA